MSTSTYLHNFAIVFVPTILLEILLFKKINIDYRCIILSHFHNTLLNGNASILQTRLLTNRINVTVKQRFLLGVT